MNKLSLMVFLALAGCADIPEPSYIPSRLAGVPPAQYQQLYDRCIKQQAELLDDGTSPADVIGNSIADACNSEYIASSMQMVKNDNSAVKRMFYQKITFDRELAAAGPTKYVLSRRNYLRTHGSH